MLLVLIQRRRSSHKHKGSHVYNCHDKYKDVVVPRRRERL
jgi:predicted RNA binding protein YcfA (HicA-like mRNA interferase family)